MYPGILYRMIYDNRQKALITALEEEGLVLRTDPSMDADFRVTGDQVCLTLDAAEKLVDLAAIARLRD